MRPRQAMRFVVLTLTLLAVAVLAPGRAQAGLREEMDIFRDLAAIFAAYPNHLQAVELKPDGRAMVIATDGTKIFYDDLAEKTFATKLETADLQDTLEQPYPLGSMMEEPGAEQDPGRIRALALLEAVYGKSESEVRLNLVSVPFLGQKVPFNKQNGAADALRRVSQDLERLKAARPDIARHLLPLGGTFAWRPIAGTARLSPHSFGIAIDLNPSELYWRTADRGKVAAARRDFPAEIVAIFEGHGFIWGGKWHSFDLMHFEYRPELVLRNRGGAELDNLAERIKALLPPVEPPAQPGAEDGQGGNSGS